MTFVITLNKLMYMFFECDISKNIWNQFKVFVAKCTKIKVSELSTNSNRIMLNNVHDNPIHIANLLVLIIKQYLFYCKCAHTVPTFCNALLQIEKYYQYELYNVKRDWKCRKTFKKWFLYAPESEKFLVNS